MPITFVLPPTSTGRVLESTLDDIQVRNVPIILLPPSHPFHALWNNHLAMLQSPGISDNVIDALIALTQNKAAWRRLLDSETTKNQLRRNTGPIGMLIEGRLGTSLKFVAVEVSWATPRMSIGVRLHPFNCTSSTSTN